MTPRLFVEDPTPNPVILSDRQSHHLVRVLRARAGDNVEIFDGGGRIWRARIVDANTGACAIAPGKLVAEGSAPRPELHLAQALLKNDAMDRVLRQATELGVSAIWPLATARGNAAEDRARARRGHWRRILISACEQSRRAHLPRIRDIQPFSEFVETADAEHTLLLHPRGPVLPLRPAKQQTTILVGPESGWTEAELGLAQARGLGVFSLGAPILRAETAPLAALAAIRHAWGWIQASDDIRESEG